MCQEGFPRPPGRLSDLEQGAADLSLLKEGSIAAP